MHRPFDVRVNDVNVPTIIELLRESIGLPPYPIEDPESADGHYTDVTEAASSMMDGSEYEYTMRAEEARRLSDTFARIAVAKRQNRHNRTKTRYCREDID